MDIIGRIVMTAFTQRSLGVNRQRFANDTGELSMNIHSRLEM